MKTGCELYKNPLNCVQHFFSGLTQNKNAPGSGGNFWV